MQMEDNSKRVAFKASELNKLIQDPEHNAQVTEEFCRDFKTMMRSLANLYNENIAVFALGSVKVSAVVTMGKDDMPIAQCILGTSDPREVKPGEAEQFEQDTKI